jgi:hypothetical protein
MSQPPKLSVPQILAWADAFYRRTRCWPTVYSGAVRGMADETWRRIDSALRLGLRGLSGGSSLPQLLAAERGARNSSTLPRLTVERVLTWADAHRRRTGRWPSSESGPVANVPGETWKAVDAALRAGVRGFPGGSSLAQLLDRRRGVRNKQALRRLTVKQVLIWADYHHLRTGAWPSSKSGLIPHTRGETWSAVDAALKSGRRGFPGGSSLARLLATERGARNRKAPPILSVRFILRWVEAHFRRTGQWPNRKTGPIREAEGETWAMVDRALCHGQRGLSGKSSLDRLLREHGMPERRGAKPRVVGQVRA